MTHPEYEEVPQCTKEQALAALRRNDPDELGVVVIGVGLHQRAVAFAEEYCLKLSTHRNEIVRGNAVLAFGHLARRFQGLSEANVKPIIESALIDGSDYVRGQAWAAADDISHFLRWKIAGFEDS